MSESKSEPPTETYLGDGLYVTHDGYQLVLRAPGSEHDNLVYMEPSVWRALQTWINTQPGLRPHLETR